MKIFRLISAVILYITTVQRLKKRKRRKLNPNEYLKLSARILQRDFPELAKNIRNTNRKRKIRPKQAPSIQKLSADEIYALHTPTAKKTPTIQCPTGYEAYPWLNNLLK